MAKKLGDIVSDIEFSDSEKARIAESFKSRNGKPYLVLHDCYSEVRAMDFWSNAHKLLSITGYRPGKAKETVLRRCLDAADDPGSKANLVLWRLYRRCVHHHMNTELLRLNTLLAKENVPENFDSSTEGVFREITRLAPLYEINQDQIREFYEIWGFARYEGFEGLFQKTGSDLDILKRLFAQENQGTQAKVQKLLDESTSKSHQEMQALRIDVRQLKSDVSRIESKLDSSVSIVRSEMQNLAAATINKKINEVSASLKKSLAETAKSGAGDPLLSEEVLRLSEQVSRLSKKVAALSTQAPTTIAKPAESSSAIKNADSDWLGNWLKQLDSSGVKDQNLFAITAIALIRSNSILLLDRLEILKPLLTAAFGNENLRIRAANPTWTSPEVLSADLDWTIDGSAQPRALVLCDFDIPLQDCYLVPALVQWRAKFESPISKVFLVRASRANPIAPRLFDLGVEVAPFDLIESTEAAASSVNTDLVRSFFSAGLSLIEPTQEAKVHEEQLRLLARNNGFRLPHELSISFSRLFTLLASLIGQETAFQTALDLTIFNWVKNVAGKERKHIFEERLNSILVAGGVNG